MIQHFPARKAVVLLGLVALVTTAPGCLFSPESGGKGPGDCVDCREPTRNTVQGAIDLYGFVWRQKRLDLYEQLLHSEYEYVPQSEDLIDLPWITPDSPWLRTDEIQMAQNMFDPEFVSDLNPEQQAVDTIEMALTPLNEASTQDGVEVITIADIQVLWAANSGAFSEVRFVFLVVEDPDEPGLFQIKRQEELDI